MYPILGGLVVIVIGGWIIIKLIQSPKFDKFCKDIENGELKNISTPKDTIKDISKAETDLNKQAALNKKEADKLKKESDGINDFLNKRDGSKEDEGKDS